MKNLTEKQTLILSYLIKQEIDRMHFKVIDAVTTDNPTFDKDVALDRILLLEEVIERLTDES
jgi:hypothetical protein